MCLGVLAIVGLQYHYWLGDAGHLAVVELTEEIDDERRINDRLERRNRLLAAEIAALKDGLDAVEARARSALGMIAEGETFFLVVDDGVDNGVDNGIDNGIVALEDEGGLPTP